MKPNEGIVFTGRTGGGKSTAMRIILQQLLRKPKRGFLMRRPRKAGCLWFTAKSDEADIAENIILGAGRGRDLIRYDPGSMIRFNPLTYEMSRKGGSAVTLSQIFRDIYQVIQRGDKKGEDFWEGHFTSCMMHAINLVWIALGEESSIEWMYQVAATSPETTKDEGKSHCKTIIERASKRAVKPDQIRQVLLAKDYFLNVLPSAGEKVRGAVLSQVLNTLLPFTMPPLSDTVNGVTNFDPETAIQSGRCVILDYDLTTYGKHGLAFQLMNSFFFLEAVLRRRDTRTPFIFARDEYQLYCHPDRDISAQGIARSQNFISMAAFQTLPVLVDGLGGGIEAKTQSQALYSCHVNKYMLNNNCVETNEMNAKICGMKRMMFMNVSNNHQQTSPWDVLGVGNVTAQMSQQYHFRVPPITFTQLATGGKENKKIVQAVYHNGFDYSLARFKQR